MLQSNGIHGKIAYAVQQFQHLYTGCTILVRLKWTTFRSTRIDQVGPIRMISSLQQEASLLSSNFKGCFCKYWRNGRCEQAREGGTVANDFTLQIQICRRWLLPCTMILGATQLDIFRCHLEQCEPETDKAACYPFNRSQVEQNSTLYYSSPYF